MRYRGLQFAVPLVLAIISCHAALASEQVIRIGVILPLSGSLEKIGQTHWRGHQLAIEEINESGGIQALGGRKLMMDYGDSSGDPIKGLREANRMIRSGDVAIIGAYQSAVVYPTSELAEKEHVPYIITTALSDALTQRGYRYTFRTGGRLSDFVTDEFRFLNEELPAKGRKPRIALLYEDSLFGQMAAGLQRTHTRKNAMELVAEIPYRSDARDVSMYVSRLIEADADIVLQTSYLDDSIKIAREMERQQYRPGIVIATGAGPKDPSFIREVGELSEGWFVISEWNPDIQKAGAEALSRRFYERFGVEMDGIAAMSYVATWVVKDALERAKAGNRDAVRDALRDADIRSGPASILPLGSISFDETGQGQFISLITQIIAGHQRTVWPRMLAIMRPVWMAGE